MNCYMSGSYKCTMHDTAVVSLVIHILHTVTTVSQTTDCSNSKHLIHSHHLYLLVTYGAI